jgi:hypothetical protein
LKVLSHGVKVALAIKAATGLAKVFLKKTNGQDCLRRHQQQPQAGTTIDWIFQHKARQKTLCKFCVYNARKFHDPCAAQPYWSANMNRQRRPKLHGATIFIPSHIFFLTTNVHPAG